MAQYTSNSTKTVELIQNNILISNYRSKFLTEICRTCLQANKENVFLGCKNSIELDTKEISLYNKLFICCPELDLRNHSQAILCLHCFKIVNIIYEFIRKRNQTERHLLSAISCKQNSHLSQNQDFGIKVEIKPEELNLSDTEGCIVREQLQLRTYTKCVSTCNKSSHIQKQFKCNQCSYCSIQKSNLEKHILYNHDGEKRFKCSQCDYSCVRKSNMLTHAHIHPKERPFQCFQCNYRSIRKNTLKAHILMHVGKRQFKCFQCDYSSVTKNNLVKHIRIHMEKPFKCPRCDYKCIQRSYLQRHFLTHTGEKLFQCFQCSYRSVRKRNLEHHILIHIGKKQFKCSQCDYCGVTKSYLLKHIRIHIREKPSEKPFKCSQCNYKSNRNDNLRRHILIHTEKKSFLF